MLSEGGWTGEAVGLSKPAGSRNFALSAIQASRLTHSGASFPVNRSQRSLAKWLQFLPEHNPIPSQRFLIKLYNLYQLQ